MNDRIFESSISKNLPWGHVRSHKKFVPDRFSRFDLLKQSNQKTDKQIININTFPPAHAFNSHHSIIRAV